MTRIAAAIPSLPRVVATILVYTLIVLALILLGAVRGPGALINSLTDFVASLPNIRENIDDIVAPLQAVARLDRPVAGRRRRRRR